MKTLLTAAWVAPMTGTGLLRDGGVVHEGGKIVAVGPATDLRQSHPDAAVEEWGDVILLPGLVNAHCHLELTLSRPRPPTPIAFADWVRRLVGEMAANSLAGASSSSSISTGFGQCMRFGVTCVGDITSNPLGGRGVLERPHPRVVSYGEVRAMATRRDRLPKQLNEAATDPWHSPWIRIGVSPHAPYSIEPEGYRQCLAVAKERGLPLATHLAETAEEAEFLAAHSGPLRELWNSFGAWDDAVPKFDGGPIRYAKHLGLLDYDKASLVHVNYCDDNELSILAKGRASVVYCPRTHRYFGHPPHRWREMLAAGINVAVGTDSCASSPDLNLVDDLRLLREIAPDVEPERIWEMATIRAARAIGMGQDVGSLEPGKAADFAVFAATEGDPLADILDDASRRVAGVWIGGERSSPAPYF